MTSQTPALKPTTTNPSGRCNRTKCQQGEHLRLQVRSMAASPDLECAKIISQLLSRPNRLGIAVWNLHSLLRHAP